MKSTLQVLLCLLLSIATAKATSLKGYVYDQKTGEAIAGASVQLEQTDKAVLTGLDGSFEIKHPPAGTFTLKVSYLMYKALLKQIVILKEDNPTLKIYLSESKDKDLSEVLISGKGDGGSEKTARRIEQKSLQLVNVVSGRAIEASPDLTVANVIQRVSGISIERSSNGDGQYAIVRGMDKRYNYTLVNGVKIPSPDNKFRYVPLDIFPSELLERLEVYKTLTPNMEADAIGGVVNMVMKDAPEKLQINANLAAGYSQMFIDRDFMGFNASDISHKSPYEVNGKDYKATTSDFPKGMVDYTSKHPAPNVIGGLSIGNRYFNNKFGILLAGSYQNNYRGSNSTFYNSQLVATDKVEKVKNMDERQYSEQQKRYGAHAKLDYVFNKNHKLSLYNAYVNLNSLQLRDSKLVDFSSEYDSEKGNAKLIYATRTRLTEQQIYNGTLQGDHQLIAEKLKLHWSAVYSSAKNEVPDQNNINILGVRENFIDRRTYAQAIGDAYTRRWERNTEDDKAGYLDFTYNTLIAGIKTEFTVGGLYRDKQRSSFYNQYVLTTNTPFALYGTDFNNYTEINWTIKNPAGSVDNALTYDASEKTTAGYGMVTLSTEKLQIIGGLRIEHTNQGYKMLFPAAELRPIGSQIYTDYLPSLNLKYKLADKQQLRASYFRSLNRPGFYEIVPGTGLIQDDYKEKGNPDLKRAMADNFDLRYELFPNGNDQLLVGAFYKKIKNPIEYTIQADPTRPQDTYYIPGNFGDARNYGLELDYIKFIHKFGIKANYTYTHSRITTSKSTRYRDEAGDLQPATVDQSRPLYGQSEHIGNISLLYKGGKNGFDAQIAAAYTGPRINTISQFLNNDLWQQGFIQMDLSAEKKFKNNLSIFVKGGNLLNTPLKLFIKGTNPNDPNATVFDGKTLIRNDYYKQTYLLGLRYKL
ncbi:TonB-dependent receptor [Pedobacter hiemivivus]|uniref:TonB-dependent receptor n=1 Tax=Pedobacter hiemivivus TaxID=2530454 RepID=A0A4U1G9S9_9SPHI|nr:TonB-dependent receptor [Pedobacter hiemivivus]TKC60314.1 TonB-dependent receptor [Pedobacter hiemivivus]